MIVFAFAINKVLITNFVTFALPGQNENQNENSGAIRKTSAVVQHTVTFLNTFQQADHEEEGEVHTNPKRSINRQQSTVYSRKPMLALGILMIVLIILISVIIYSI